MAASQPQYKQYLTVTGATWQVGNNTWRNTEGHWVDTVVANELVFAIVIETAGGVVKVPIERLKVVV